MRMNPAGAMGMGGKLNICSTITHWLGSMNIRPFVLDNIQFHFNNHFHPAKGNILETNSVHEPAGNTTHAMMGFPLYMEMETGVFKS